MAPPTARTARGFPAISASRLYDTVSPNFTSLSRTCSTWLVKESVNGGGGRKGGDREDEVWFNQSQTIRKILCFHTSKSKQHLKMSKEERIGNSYSRWAATLTLSFPSADLLHMPKHGSLSLTLGKKKKKTASTCYRGRCEKIISMGEKSRLCFERSELKLKKFAPSFKRIKRGQKDCKSAPDF